jgi:hypothetical protein
MLQDELHDDLHPQLRRAHGVQANRRGAHVGTTHGGGSLRVHRVLTPRYRRARCVPDPRVSQPWFREAGWVDVRCIGTLIMPALPHWLSHRPGLTDATPSTGLIRSHCALRAANPSPGRQTLSYRYHPPSYGCVEQALRACAWVGGPVPLPRQLAARRTQLASSARTATSRATTVITTAGAFPSEVVFAAWHPPVLTDGRRRVLQRTGPCAS